MVEGDVMTVYCDHLKNLIVKGADNGDRPLEGMKIVVDAGNGSGGFYAKRVLKPLGQLTCQRASSWSLTACFSTMRRILRIAMR